MKIEFPQITREAAEAKEARAAAWTLAVAQNAATNGRAFCAMLFAACISMYVVTRDPFIFKLAVIAALPVGLAQIAALYMPPFLRNVVGALCIAIASAVFAFLLAA